MKYFKLYFLFVLLSIASCKTAQETTKSTEPEKAHILSDAEAKEIQGGMWIP